MNLLCTEKQKMNSNTVLLFAFLLNVFFTHTLFICVALERYSTKNILPLHTIYIANRFSFCNKHTNSIVTILIIDLLTLGIIRTVDIFTSSCSMDIIATTGKFRQPLSNVHAHYLILSWQINLGSAAQG